MSPRSNTFPSAKLKLQATAQRLLDPCLPLHPWLIVPTPAYTKPLFHMNFSSFLAQEAA